MTTKKRERILANMKKTAEKVGKWPLPFRAVLGTRGFTKEELEAYKAGKCYIDDEDRP